jgi:hypothetical protein
MATKSLVCSECQAPVAPGRFSCAACGALLVATAEPAWAAPPAVVASPASPAVEAMASSHEAGPAESFLSPGPMWPLAPAERIPAGAYLPPSAVLPPAETLPIRRPSPRSAGADPRAAVASATAGAQETLTELGLSTDTPRLLVASAAAIAALSFLLPWSSIVVGSGQLGGYTASWGLAGPGHPIVALALVGLGSFAMAGERLPRWARPGLPALILAGLVVGLVWPYLMGPLGAMVGSWVAVAGSLLLVVGGALDLRTGRHQTVTSSV